ncbi:CLUMA_CG004295, isoform A [Clunio marinus]|uniref:CLUMA_CG004295, isoform A n=1 Tax=Clunio marinus TaxID=568069 RepID=A0A1J1HWU0_9DIPT|nr:CLUMA_CG004295, isoform A [Clunio marinus]
MKIIFGISLFAILFALCNASHNLKCEPVTGHQITGYPLDHPTESPEISTETPFVDPSCWIDECDEREWTIEDSLKAVDECINIIMKLLEELIGEEKFKKFREWWDNPFGGPLYGELFEGLSRQDERSKELLKKIIRTFELMDGIVRLLKDENLRDSYCTPCPPHKLNQSFFSEIYFKLNNMMSKLFSVPDHFHPDHPRTETPEESSGCADQCGYREGWPKTRFEEILKYVEEIWKLLQELSGDKLFGKFRGWLSNLKPPYKDEFVPDDDELDPEDERFKRLLEITEKIKVTFKQIHDFMDIMESSEVVNGNCNPCPPYDYEFYVQYLVQLFDEISPCYDECYDRDERIKEKYEEIRKCIEELWKLIKELLGDNLFGKFRDWWDQLRPPFGNEFEPDPEFNPKFDLLRKILDMIEKIIKCVREIENEKDNPFLLDVNCYPCPPYNSKDEPSEDENSHDIWFKYLIFRTDPFKIYIPTLPWPLPPLPLIYQVPFVFED